MLLSNDEGAINLEKAPAPAPLLLKLGTVLTLLFAPLLTGLVYAAHALPRGAILRKFCAIRTTICTAAAGSTRSTTSTR